MNTNNYITQVGLNQFNGNLIQNPSISIPLVNYQTTQHILNPGVNFTQSPTSYQNNGITASLDNNQDFSFLLQRTGPNAEILKNLQTYNGTLHESIEPSIASTSNRPSLMNSIQPPNDRFSSKSIRSTIMSTYQLSNPEINELINLVNIRNSNNTQNNPISGKLLEDKNMNPSLTPTQITENINSPISVQPIKYETKSTQTQDMDTPNSIEKNIEVIDQSNITQTPNFGISTLTQTQFIDLPKSTQIQNISLQTPPQIQSTEIIDASKSSQTENIQIQNIDISTPAPIQNIEIIDTYNSSEIQNNDFLTSTQIQNYDNTDLSKITQPNIDNIKLSTFPEMSNIESIKLSEPDPQIIDSITYPGPGQTPIIEINTSALPSQEPINENIDLSTPNPSPVFQPTNILHLSAPISQTAPLLSLNSVRPDEGAEFGEYQSTTKILDIQPNFIPPIPPIIANPSVIVTIPEKRIIKVPKIQRVIVPKVQRVYVPSQKKILMRRRNSAITRFPNRFSLSSSTLPIIRQSYTPIQPSIPYNINTVTQPALIPGPVPLTTIAPLPQLSYMTSPQIPPTIPQIPIAPNILTQTNPPLLSLMPNTQNILIPQPQPQIPSILQNPYSTSSINPILYNNSFLQRNGIPRFSTPTYRGSIGNNFSINGGANTIGTISNFKPPIKYSSKTYNAIV